MEIHPFGCSLFYSWCEVLKVFLNVEPGTHTFVSIIESNDEITFEIKPGEIHYVKCSVVMGVIIARPKLEKVDSVEGKIIANLKQIY